MYRDYLYKMLSITYHIYMHKNFKGFINMLDISKLVGREEIDWLYEGVRYLESMGLLKPLFMVGAVYAKITPRGIMFVEDELAAHKDDIIVEPSYDNIRKLDGQHRLEDIIQARAELFAVLAVIKHKLNEDPKYRDILHDIDIFTSELHKEDPDREIIYNNIDTLRTLEPVQIWVDELSILLNL